MKMEKKVEEYIFKPMEISRELRKELEEILLKKLKEKKVEEML